MPWAWEEICWLFLAVVSDVRKRIGKDEEMAHLDRLLERHVKRQAKTSIWQQKQRGRRKPDVLEWMEVAVDGGTRTLYRRLGRCVLCGTTLPRKWLSANGCCSWCVYKGG